MILTRLGNKRSLAEDLYKHFPKHKMRIELFAGAGGAFFYMPPARYTILNDLDDDVTNLYWIVQNRKEALIKSIELLPISSSLIKKWKSKKETDPLLKAVRFLLLSNFTYLGKGDTIRIGLDNSKQNLLDYIEPTFLALKNVKITNCDFREVIPKISFSETVLPKREAFVFLDPIYFETTHYYNVPKWSKKDTLDCFDILTNSGLKCGMCEFDHPFILEAATERKLNIIPIKNRHNIKTRQNEIFITNYKSEQYELF